MSRLHCNIELKARYADHAGARAILRETGAAYRSQLRQLDTYFPVANGRLKLRETEGRPAELIWYARADSPTFRESQYHLSPAPDPASLKQTLAAGLGIRGVIRKVRDLYLFHNVRVHLDTVEGLGTFLEFEAVISPSDGEAISRERLATLHAALKIRVEDHLDASYADLAGL